MSVQVNASEPELGRHPKKLRAACFIYLPPADYTSASTVYAKDILQYCKNTTIFALALQHTPIARTDLSDTSYAPSASQRWLLVMP
jgi:hypothetical protein